MATAKTGSFYLTETVQLSAASASGSRIQGTIDLGAYVNVATGQAIAIDQVDFVYQAGTDFSSDVSQMLAGNGALTTQLVDLNPGTAFVRADNQSLIASGALNIDVANAIASHSSDIFPDNFGTAGSLSEMFMVVNDTLYVTAGNDNAAVGAQTVSVTARIRARVVKLGSKDWMALALQSTASDN
tara:strand:+ start:292 stop:846 length:555 start_codon:yes stop_codon:yes gene_type:complete